MSERAGSRVGKQLEDRSVGKCATTTDREPRCTRGKKEKELVKKDGVRSIGQGAADPRMFLAQNTSVSEICTSCGSFCVLDACIPPITSCSSANVVPFSTNLLVFLVGFLCDQLCLCQLSLQDCHAVVLHVVLVLQRLPYPGPPVKSNSDSSSSESYMGVFDEIRTNVVISDGRVGSRMV